MNPVPTVANNSPYGWIGVDLDGTLAHYDHGKPYKEDEVGEPVPAMLERVSAWIAAGKEVRIFTARVFSDGTPEREEQVKKARRAIVAWCRKHLNCTLAVTNVKDYRMLELWDDRAVQVEPNTGRVVGHSTRGLS